MAQKKPTKPAFGQLASNVQRNTMRWVWDHRIPVGAISLLDGDGGVGKSSLALDLVARVTVGDAMPDGSNSGAAPAGVVLLTSGEDSLEEVLVPRLDAAGADQQRVWTIHGEAFRIPLHLPALERAIQEVQAGLVVIDPLSDFVEGDLGRNKAARDSLRPLTLLASKCSVGVLAIRNLTKSGLTVSAAGLGAASIRNLARSQLITVADPDEPKRSVIAVAKSNVSALAPTLGFEVVEFPVPNVVGPVTRVVWMGERPFAAEDLLKMNRGMDPLRRYQIDLACELIEDLLTVVDAKGNRSKTHPNGDPVTMPARAIQLIAKQQGLEKMTTWRAFRSLGGITKPGEGGPGVSGWYWRLP